jgi:prefoldin beta subunit
MAKDEGGHSHEHGHQPLGEQEGPMGDPNAIIAQFQMLQQQLQSCLMQKDSLTMSQIEVDRALEELGKTKEETAYKIIGNVMVKKSVADIKASLEDTKESIGIRLQTLEKTEKRTADMLRGLQDKLKGMMKQ